jgi:tRNA pseudouridine38-40 synthase
MRIALGVEYNGNAFNGWQAQENLPTVQGCLELALSKIANESIEVFCAGRTDAGVHATGQVVHFDTNAIRDMRAWTLGTNTNLPSSIAIRWGKEVDEHFHARYSAKSRCYRYHIYNESLRPGILSGLATWQYVPLDHEAMNKAAQHLIGEHDFTSFRSSQCESKTPMRNLLKINVLREKQMVIIEVEANAFLHHMVRNIVGVLMEVGKGVRSTSWPKEVLEAKDRRLAAPTAPAAGLYLVGVKYPADSLPL